MAPTRATPLYLGGDHGHSSSIFGRGISDDASSLDYLAQQWHNPGDILSVLMLLGPDIIQGAIAQLSGRTITPVAFSFGWAAYAFNALRATIGGGMLMPDAAAEAVVVDAVTGHSRTTRSWVINKLISYLDDRVDNEMKSELFHVPPRNVAPPKSPTPHKSPTSALPPSPKSKVVGVTKTRPWEALRVSVYRVVVTPADPYTHGVVPSIDWVWASGFVTISIQIAISILPWVLQNDWVIFLVAVIGNLLALSGASLPQWTEEKWACPKKGGSTVTLTRGNGSRHASVILGERGVGLDLEILARGTRTSRITTLTRVLCPVLAVAWVVLLITVSGIVQNTWCRSTISLALYEALNANSRRRSDLVGIGLIGSVQNVTAAGATRKPNALGIHIQHQEVVRGSRVAQVLMEVEKKYPLVGTSLLPVFFPGPGSLRAKDKDLEFWRQAMKRRLGPNTHGDCIFTTQHQTHCGPKEAQRLLLRECTDAIRNGRHPFQAHASSSVRRYESGSRA